ncbi:TPA: glycosyltransferase family 2 protein, partial [Campylobacter coli]|nr:glycosyltransferase family 2 protein [Campylobacter coli]
IEYFGGEYKLKNKAQAIKENSLIEFSLEDNNPYEIYTVYKSYKAFNDKKDLINFTYPNIDYIIFLDSDDYWELSCIEECVPRMDGVDILWFDVKTILDGVNYDKWNSEMKVYGYSKETIISSLDWLMKSKKIEYFWFAWQGMINFTFLKNIKLKFIDRIIHEDHHFGSLLFAQAKYIYIYPKENYTYRIRDNSIMNNTGVKIYSKSYLYDLYLSFSKNMLNFKSYLKAYSFLMTFLEFDDFVRKYKDKTIASYFYQIFLKHPARESWNLYYFDNDPYCAKDGLSKVQFYFK